MPTYHPYAEKNVNGTDRAGNKALVGATTTERIIAMWKQGMTFTDIASTIRCSRGQVSGAVHRYKIKYEGHKPTHRGYYENPRTVTKSFPTWGYDKYRPFNHEADTTMERAARDKLRSFLR